MHKMPMSSKVTALVRHRSFQNFVFLIFIQSSNALISLISIPLLIRSLGVDQFGMVNLALSVIVFANVAVNFGYSLSGPREIAVNQENPRAMSEVASKVFFSRFFFALLISVALGLLTLVDGLFQGYQIILLFSLLMLFSEATQPVWFFQGLEKMRMVSLSNLSSKLLYLVGLLLFVKGPGDAKWVNLIMGFTALGFNVVLMGYMQVKYNIRLYLPKWRLLLTSWRTNFSLFLSGLASHFSVSGGIIILSFFVNATVLGMFSMAEKVTVVLRMIPTLITQAAYPNASKLFIKDDGMFYNFVRKVYFGSIGISLFIAVIVYLFSPDIILMLSKKELEDSVDILRILSFVPVMASLNIANMIIILAGGFNKILLNATWTFCCFMIIACSLLSYFFGGPGMAYGLLGTELFIFATCSILLKANTPYFDAFYKRIFSSHYSA
ncbi:MAG TPA: oligosaccharide flippase family protein [Cyclobacteriaceae bacterium]|nr:oligosaccharide flippase family protein [Cyclobacteriaceae bacterium]